MFENIQKAIDELDEINAELPCEFNADRYNLIVEAQKELDAAKSILEKKRGML